MNYVNLGRTGVKVSELCFGTMSFGGDADEAMSEKMFDRCLEAGINFFDCANVYQSGTSEEILGKLMKPHRDDLVITSKVFGKMREGLGGGGINGGGLSRRSIVREVEQSLRRLNTDRIDVYFVHQFDRDTPIEETVRALDQLVRQGKILYPAVSNWAAWQIATALGISAREGLARFEVIQPMYNLTKRQVEVEILPLALAEELAVTPYSPLGGGLLTGKYDTQNKPDSGRLVENSMYTKRYGEDFYFEIAEKFTEYANGRGVHPATLAVAWVLAHPAVTSPIIGARNLEQLEASLAAAEVEMSMSEWLEISSRSFTPPLPTDRAEEAK